MGATCFVLKYLNWLSPLPLFHRLFAAVCKGSDRIRIQTDTNNPICAICHEPLLCRLVYPTALASADPHRCRKHVFHYECLKAWYDQSVETGVSSCPSCRNCFTSWICLGDIGNTESKHTAALLSKCLRERLGRTCRVCQRVYKYRGSRQKCESRHKGGFRCYLCNRTFTMKWCLHRHNRTMHQ